MFKKTEHIFVVVAGLCFMVFLLVVGNAIFSCSKQIQEHGLKAIIEEIWEGKEK